MVEYAEAQSASHTMVRFVPQHTLQNMVSDIIKFSLIFKLID